MQKNRRALSEVRFWASVADMMEYEDQMGVAYKTFLSVGDAIACSLDEKSDGRPKNLDALQTSYDQQPQGKTAKEILAEAVAIWSDRPND